MPLIAKLVVVGGEVKTAEIKLRLPSTIGRGRGATIMLPHPLVSRQHCELFETDGRLMVRDLGSLNGTFINNERISEAALPPGELLTVGAVTFRAVYESGDASGPPEGPGPQLKATHSRDTDPNGTVRAPAKSAAPASSQSAATEEEPAFDFEMPLVPVDEDARITDKSPEKKPFQNVAEQKPAEKKPLAQSKPAQPKAALSKPAAPKPAQSKPDDQTVPVPESPTAKSPTPEKATQPAAAPAAPDSKSLDFSKWDHEEEDEIKPEGEEDGDFGDFLKSLGPK